MDSFRDTYKSIIHVGLKLVTDMLRPQGVGVSDDDYDIRLLSFFSIFHIGLLLGSALIYLQHTRAHLFISNG